MAKNVVIVTGSNRGLGLEVSKMLAETTSLAPYILYCTSRKGEKTEIAAQFPDSEVRFRPLDIGNLQQINALRDEIKQEGHVVKVLIANGALADDTLGFTKEVCKRMFDVNYRGNVQLCQAFLPLMRPGSRIVLVSSSAIQQEGLFTAPHQKAIVTKPDLTIEDLNGLLAEFENGMPAKMEGLPYEGSHFLYPIYTVTKAGVTMFGEVLARENPGILVNSCCPGANGTEMTLRNSPWFEGLKDPKDGAKILYNLACGDIGNQSGYWANDTVFQTGVGTKREWYNAGLASAQKDYQHTEKDK